MLRHDTIFRTKLTIWLKTILDFVSECKYTIFLIKIPDFFQKIAFKVIVNVCFGVNRKLE